jgi:AcrR family transcriptional regulator
MPRVVKEYAVRRNEILDATYRLVVTKGYEQMTIQDILDDLHISKGAFYHYFASKQELLEAMIERMLADIQQVLQPIIQDDRLLALEKFQRVFDTIARTKNAQKSFVVALLRIWYTDENAIVRQKLRAIVIQQVAPLLAVLIRQGIREGIFSTRYPEQSGEVVLSVVYDLSETLGMLMLACGPAQADLAHIENTIGAFTEALERILGAPDASLHLVDLDMMKEWLLAAE